MPEIKDDKFQVMRLERDESGTKIAPEAQPARRLLNVSDFAAMSAGGTPETNRIVQQKPFDISVSIEMPAIDLAKGASVSCVLCSHWDREAMRQYIRAKSSTKAGITELNSFRGELLLGGHVGVNESHITADDDYDVDAALNAMGVCHPLTEMEREVIFTHPGAQCPATLSNGVTPFPSCFTPRTPGEQKISSKIFDDVMLTAAGKK